MVQGNGTCVKGLPTKFAIFIFNIKIARAYQPGG